jgi:MCM P-loop domain/MCM AAA-lid domain
MEQQTLSVAKAGIVCKLNCRATIVAVMNPRDCLYDNHSSLAVNTGLGTPLLSRFDLIFKLVDSSDAERDNNVTTYLLNRAIQGAGFEVSDAAGDIHSSRPPWSMEKLRAYISAVKDRFQPAMSDEAALLLERHYEKCRSTPCNTIPVTVRFLESLIRLSQAHARLMHRGCNTVTLHDAIAVIQVMECTAFAYGGFDGIGVDDSQAIMYCDPIAVDFSPEPDLDFLCFEYRILERYNMLDYIDDDRKSRALTAFGTSTTGGDHSWDDVERGQFRPTNNHVASESYSASQPPISQDHYGRNHFVSSTQKRQRR